MYFRSGASNVLWLSFKPSSELVINVGKFLHEVGTKTSVQPLFSHYTLTLLRKTMKIMATTVERCV